MSILARSKPYREPAKKTYTCDRCGITRTNHTKRTSKHCLDCKPYAKEESANG